MNEENLGDAECTDVFVTEESVIEKTESAIEGLDALCRICANRAEALLSIYSEEGITNDLADKVNLYLPIKVNKDDTLPLQCCYHCASTILTWHELVIASVEADRRLREIQSDIEKQLAQPNSEPGPSQIEEEKIIESEEDRSKKVVTNTRRRESELRTKKTSRNVKQCAKCNKIFYNERRCKMCSEEINKLDTFVDNDCDSSLRRDEKVKATKSIHKVHDEKETESNGNLTQYDSDHSVLEFPKPKYVRRKKAEVVAEHFCDVCSKGFTRKFDMLKHRAKAHQNAPEPPKTTYKKNSELILRCQITGPDGMKGYKCETCGKIIRFIYNFIRHQSTHTGARPYFCHMCGKSYPILSTLTRHIREYHQRVKKFTCDICDKKFAAKAALEEHKNIHTNERPFVCDACGKSFKQKSSLHIHKIFHSNVFRFSCSMCGKKFRRSRDLKVHSWLHTGHRPYACKICGSMFRLSQDLKRHNKVHNKVSIQSSCTECGATFNHQKQLINHIKIHQVQIEDQKSEVKAT